MTCALLPLRALEVAVTGKVVFAQAWIVAFVFGLSSTISVMVADCMRMPSIMVSLHNGTSAKWHCPHSSGDLLGNQSSQRNDIEPLPSKGSSLDA